MGPKSMIQTQKDTIVSNTSHHEGRPTLQAAL